MLQRHAQRYARFAFLFGLGLFLVACGTPGSQEVPKTQVDDVHDIDVPDDFDFSTTRELSLNLNAKGDLGEVLDLAVISIYEASSSKLFLKALTDTKGQLETQLIVPTYVETLRIELDHDLATKSQELTLSAEDSLSVNFGPKERLRSLSSPQAFHSCAANAFLFQNGTTDIYNVNLSTGAYSSIADDISSASGIHKVNAVGYNVTDDFIYGYEQGLKDGSIVKIGADYGVTVLGPITGLTGSRYVGDVSADGKYYLTYANSPSFDVVDVNPSSAEYLYYKGSFALSKSIKIFDWSFNPKDNMLYAVANETGSTLYRIDPATGNVEDLGSTNVPQGTYGAGYYDSNGYYYISNNDTGVIYRIDTTTPASLSSSTPIDANSQVSQFTTGPSSSSNDGARCMNAGTPTADSDGDTVNDDLDDFPVDPNLVFSNITSGTLAFEDRWPHEDDYDFNDVVVNYSIDQITNISNEVAEIQADFTFQAVGAAYANAFALELPFAPSVIANISGADVLYEGEWSYLSFNANKTEANQSKAVVFVSDDTSRTLGYLVNTDPNGNTADPVTVSLVIELTSPQPLANLNPPYNPFILSNLDGLSLSGFAQARDRGREIHLPNHEPTDLADANLFGTGDDNSDAGQNRYYMTSSNLPWALNIPETFDYTQERKQIITGHAKFATWVSSGGSSYADWYQDKSDYRVSINIY